MTSRPPPLIPKAESSSSLGVGDEKGSDEIERFRSLCVLLRAGKSDVRILVPTYGRNGNYDACYEPYAVHEYIQSTSRSSKIYDDPYDGKTPNAYHNAHGADVLWSTSHLIRALRTELKVSLKLIDNPDIIFDISIAALFHDYRHLGVNNDFLKRSRRKTRHFFIAIGPC